MGSVKDGYIITVDFPVPVGDSQRSALTSVSIRKGLAFEVFRFFHQYSGVMMVSEDPLLKITLLWQDRMEMGLILFVGGNLLEYNYESVMC